MTESQQKPKTTVVQLILNFLGLPFIKQRLSDWRNRTYQKLVDKVVAYGIKKNYYKEKPPQKVIEKVPTYVYIDKVEYVTQTVFVNQEKKEEDLLFDSTGGYIDRPPFVNLAPPVMQNIDISKPEDIAPVQLGAVNVNVIAKLRDGSFQCTISGTQFLSFNPGQKYLKLKLINWFDSDPSLGYYGIAFSLRVVDGVIESSPHIDSSFDWKTVFPLGLEAERIYPIPDGYYRFVENIRVPSEEPISVETPEEIERRKNEIREFLDVARSWVNEAPPVVQTASAEEDNKNGKIDVIILRKKEDANLFECQVFGAYIGERNIPNAILLDLEIKNFHKYIGIQGLDLDPYRTAFSINVIDGVLQESQYVDSSKINIEGIIPIPNDLSQEILREDSILMTYENYLNT